MGVRGRAATEDNKILISCVFYPMAKARSNTDCIPSFYRKYLITKSHPTGSGDYVI
jgi:hypothetical protein